MEQLSKTEADSPDRPAAAPMQFPEPRGETLQLIACEITLHAHSQGTSGTESSDIKFMHLCGVVLIERSPRRRVDLRLGQGSFRAYNQGGLEGACSRKAFKQSGDEPAASPVASEQATRLMDLCSPQVHRRHVGWLYSISSVLSCVGSVVSSCTSGCLRLAMSAKLVPHGTNAPVCCALRYSASEPRHRAVQSTRQPAWCVGSS
jgi:hypothetical protein